MVDFECSDISLWREALSSYSLRIQSINKPNLVSLDEFYRLQLPSLLHQRKPNPYLTTPELSHLMQWKLSRGKWRPRLLDFVSSLDEELVKSASQKAFGSLPDISKAICDLTVLKGVGPATASAVLAAYAPDVAPFMSDEAMKAALGSSKDYTLKQYLLFVNKLQTKSKELSLNGDLFTPSDVERALWSSAVQVKSEASRPPPDQKIHTRGQDTKRKRKR
ncbi:DNA binding [Euphorbia peplus]|nr:DNA binding [Euphorbia peplus]